MTTNSRNQKNHISPGKPSPRIAIIGCGAIAEAYYLPAMTRHKDILDSLTLVDQNAERAQALAETFDCQKWATDYHDILEETDGVIIALPIHLHHTVAIEFLRHQTPVLCEKPLAETADKANEMVLQAQKSGVALATNYGQRLWPQIAKVKELIEKGSLGKPVNIKYYVGEVFNWPTVSGFYFNSDCSTRGVLRDRGAHVLDQVCWWLGDKPKVIESRNDSFGGSDAVAFVKFEHKTCVGEIHLSWISNFPCKFIIEFEKATVEGEIYYPQSILVKQNSRPAKRVNLKAESYQELGFKLVDNFIDVIRKKEKPLVPGNDILNSVIMIDECYRMATHFDEPWYENLEVKYA